MTRMRIRLRELTPRRRCHEDLRAVIADVNLVLRGWRRPFFESLGLCRLGGTIRYPGAA